MSIRNETTRPLTARSIIASTLLGTHPPRMPVAQLVRSCELFGIRENAARVALSRMVTAGELSVENGRYSLLGHLRDRQSRQDESRRGLASAEPWDGTWVLAVVGPDPRSAPERAQLRTALRRARYAEWREGLWLRPDNLAGAEGNEIAATGCTLVPSARPPAAKALARSLFRIDAWTSEAGVLLKDMDALSRQLVSGDTLALTSGFVRNAAVLRHLQADPLLPSELLPKTWPGSRLRERYERFDEAFVALWRANLREAS